MSDEIVSTEVPTETAAIEPALAVLSAGALLRQARDASGMHMATLSMALKVPIKKLEALEADDWASLPDPVFVRALATSVCRQIKTDSAPILAALPAATQARLIDDRAGRGLNQRFRAPSDPKPSLTRLPISMPMMLAALIFLLAAIVIIFLPDLQQKNDKKVAEVVEVVAPQAAVIVPAVVASDVVVMPIVVASSAAPTIPPVALAPTPAPAPAPATAASKPAAAAVVPPSPSSPSVVTAPVSNPALRMVAKGVVWVEVKDAKGTLLVQRTMQPKEVINVNGTAPLAVVVGRINEMQSVDVRGKPFSLAGLSPDNVARFEVK